MLDADAVGVSDFVAVSLGVKAPEFDVDKVWDCERSLDEVEVAEGVRLMLGESEKERDIERSLVRLEEAEMLGVSDRLLVCVCDGV